ncbi:hypothetical protein [Sinanaerobacter sp. ZZT-01]|uniref:hypothetical protein n=1 Tax=Sinanaerobacter sp. ZZT-01 TaxID=3111540 RepID=UPI002D784785|nr:hypothetical protein [Sinanaerobacter sp. ZZT-01]WRR92943.1 hypothetical protein U5921_13005 [Sinanaerobacter sp. ZZT-01]
MLKKIVVALICGVISIGLISCGSAADDKTDTLAQNEEKDVVLVDDEYVKIIYSGLDENNETIPTLKLSIENKTDQTFAVQTEKVSADDSMVTTYFSESPAPGEKIDANLELEEVEKGFNSVEGTFVLIDDNYDTLKEEPFKISLDDTAKIEKEDQKEETGVVIVDDDYAKITYLGFAEESNMGPTLKLSVENKTDKTFMILTDQFYVDDKEIESMMSCDRVASGKKANAELTLYADKDFKTVKGTFVLNDEENNTIATEQVEFEVQ